MIRRRIQRQETAQQPVQIRRREYLLLHDHLHHRSPEVGAWISGALLDRVALADANAAAAAFLDFPAVSSPPPPPAAAVVKLSRENVVVVIGAGHDHRLFPGGSGGGKGGFVDGFDEAEGVAGDGGEAEEGVGVAAGEPAAAAAASVGGGAHLFGRR